MALNETRHFGQAAKLMNVSQPTLSLQIQKLEEELGAGLFDRSKQPIVPTDAGERVVEQARRILDEAKTLESMLVTADEFSGVFRIGVIPTLSADILAKFVPAMLEKFPKLQLEVSEMVTESIVDALKRDELDAGLLVTPLKDSGLQEFPLFYEPLLAYLPDDHPLLERKNVTTGSLKQTGLLLLSEGHCFRSQVLEICRHRKAKRDDSRFQLESGSFEALVGLVDAGVGYTILPRLATDRLITDSARKKRVRPFELPEPVREVSLVRSRLFTKKKIADQIVLEIQQKAAAGVKIRPDRQTIIPIDSN